MTARLKNIYQKLKSAYHYCLAWLGNVIYGSPSKDIFVIGVTGTKGKSTTLELINAILEMADKKTALVSSLRFKIANKTIKNTTGMTMPGRFFIQKKLRKAVKAGCQYFLIEVTSQGILQHRHEFIDFDAAIYTNVRPEHVEAHGSFDNYRGAKVSFFKYAADKSRKRDKSFFINDEDDSKGHFVNAVGDNKVIYFSRDNFIDKNLNKGKISIGDWLSNNFNLENAAAATALAESQGIDWDTIHRALQAFSGIPGRLEYAQRKPFAVVIDYAHTPDSLTKVYQALIRGGAKVSARNSRGSSRTKTKTKTSVSTSKLICVLGAAGGGRDKWKRPVMGQIAAQYCRNIILTNEDPYDEKPEKILEDIKNGILQTKFPVSNIAEILDRRAAIAKAISLAKRGDTVIITGKGSEDWLRVAQGNKIPWSERKAVEKVLKE
ncbi:MAG: UDP-N-acetylmuramyl-tripeptide synthetase [bacterium]|nr:UDP-N-acetylmuramyl-tripeptide synthetase [bacterium]